MDIGRNNGDGLYGVIGTVRVVDVKVSFFTEQYFMIMSMKTMCFFFFIWEWSEQGGRKNLGGENMSTVEYL